MTDRAPSGRQPATGGPPGALAARVPPRRDGHAIDAVPTPQRPRPRQGGDLVHEPGAAPLASGGTGRDPRRPPAAPHDPAAPITPPDELPPRRVLLVLDNLAGHRTPSFVLWLSAHGVPPLYTPRGGRWPGALRTMAESIQRMLKRRTLEGTRPMPPADSSAAWEATARGWNRDPTPFVWGGQRAARRDRARQRRHALGGAGAQIHRPVRRRTLRATQWRHTE